MRVFVAGASGVIGIRLVPLLVAEGHEVAGMTRTPSKTEAPETVLHQLTDLPDDASQIAEFGSRNDRIRHEGTRNLLAAASVAGSQRLWLRASPGISGASAVLATRRFEQLVLDARGVVIRYRQLYGPGTHYEDEPPPPSRIHIDEAARRTAALLDADTGVVELVEPE